jgi:DHA1 family bicyclomycin/chloramphenicol resistance-like MFS transporter
LPLLLGFLSATGPLSTDMYLPAFPAIETSLGVPIGSAQWTLASWFLGLAIGQITQGSLSDRFGRKAPLMVATAVFTLANVGCALSTDLVTLSLMRFIAAIGGSASMVIPRAVVRDLSEGHAAARMMSRLVLVSGVAPILAPTLGGLLLKIADWHFIFWFTVLYGTLCCILVIFFLPDTLPVSMRVRQGGMQTLTRFGQILSERSFLCNALMGGAGMFAMFAYIGGSPGVFIEGMHLSPAIYAVMFSSGAFFFILFSQLNPMLLLRFGSDRLLRVAVRCFLAATIALVLIAFISPHLPGGLQWWMVMVPVMGMLACQGMNMPNSTVAALQRHAAHAGTASALMGMMGFCMAAVSGLAVGVLSDGTAKPLAVLALVGAVGANVADLYRRRDLMLRSSINEGPKQ